MLAVRKNSSSFLSFSNFFTIFAIGKEPNQTQGIMVKVLRYLDPRADLTFKKIFGEHADLATSFLNALLPLKEGGADRDRGVSARGACTRHPTEEEHDCRRALQGQPWTAIPCGNANVLDRHFHAARALQCLQGIRAPAGQGVPLQLSPARLLAESGQRCLRTQDKGVLPPLRHRQHRTHREGD